MPILYAMSAPLTYENNGLTNDVLKTRMDQALYLVRQHVGPDLWDVISPIVEYRLISFSEIVDWAPRESILAVSRSVLGGVLVRALFPPLDTP